MTDLLADVRTSPTLVKEMIETTLTGVELNVFINFGHRLTERVNTADTGNLLSDDDLLLLETLLSAHYCAVMRSPLAQSQSVGNEWRVTYQMAGAGEGLHGSSYGQQAMALDPTGTLQNANKPKAKISINKLGAGQ